MRFPKQSFENHSSPALQRYASTSTTPYSSVATVVAAGGAGGAGGSPERVQRSALLLPQNGVAMDGGMF